MTAIGRLWAFEDHPQHKLIAKHTVAVTKDDPCFGNFDEDVVKVGPANWTHSNQFCCMDDDPTKCDSTDITCANGRIDRLKILRDPKQKKTAEYLENVMVYQVFLF